LIDSLLHALVWILLVGGAAFCVIGAVGMLRLPDFYTRTHAATLPDTLGAGMILLGLMLQSGLNLPLLGEGASLRIGDGNTLVTLKLLTLLLFLLATGPASTHALVKAAYARGIRWNQASPQDDSSDSKHADPD